MRDNRPEKMDDGTSAAPAPVQEERRPTAAPADADSAPPAADAEQPPLGDDPEPSAEEFDDQIANCQNDLDAIDQQIEELRRQRTQVEAEKDELIEQKRKFFPPPNQAQALRAYLDQQQKNREDRAERLGRLIETGLISGKAPIDAVRQRAKGHGNRPVQYPPLNKA